MLFPNHLIDRIRITVYSELAADALGPVPSYTWQPTISMLFREKRCGGIKCSRANRLNEQRSFFGKTFFTSQSVRMFFPPFPCLSQNERLTKLFILAPPDPHRRKQQSDQPTTSRRLQALQQHRPSPTLARRDEHPSPPRRANLGWSCRRRARASSPARESRCTAAPPKSPRRGRPGSAPAFGWRHHRAQRRRRPVVSR